MDRNRDIIETAAAQGQAEGRRAASTGNSFDKAEQALRLRYREEGAVWEDQSKDTRILLVDSFVMMDRMSGLRRHEYRDYGWICRQAALALTIELERLFCTGFLRYLRHIYGDPDACRPEYTFRSWPEELLSCSREYYENCVRHRQKAEISVRKDYKTSDAFRGSIPERLQELFPGRNRAAEPGLITLRMNEYLSRILREQTSESASSSETTTKTPTELLCGEGSDFVGKCTLLLNSPIRRTSPCQSEAQSFCNEIYGPKGILPMLYRTFRNPDSIKSFQKITMTGPYIGSNKFNTARKDVVRDYYTYGFKTCDQNPKSRSSQDNYWKQLQELLDDEWTFEKGGDGNRYIQISTPIHRSVRNPLDDLYFSHLSSCFPAYLVFLLALDPEVDVHLPGRYPAAAPDGGTRSGDLTLMMDLCCTERQTIGRRANDLKSWGCIDEAAARRNEEGRPTDRPLGNSALHYVKSSLTMNRMLRQPGPADHPAADGKDSLAQAGLPAFLLRFYDLCRFFSQYYYLGEIGTFLCRRMDYALSAEDLRTDLPAADREFVSFRQNYIQKSVYDYNLWDLLYAAEQSAFCLITYSHGTGPEPMSESQYLIVPLEIRISAIDGREYVICYNVHYHCLLSLRLEFIKETVVYRSIEEYSVTITTGTSEKTETVGIRMDSLRRRLQTARDMLPGIWGREVPRVRISADWRKHLRSCEILTDYAGISEMDCAITPGNPSLITKSSAGENSSVRNLSGEGGLTEGQSRDSAMTETEGVVLRLECFPTREISSWVRYLYPHVRSLNSNMVQTGFSSVSSGTFDIVSDIAELQDLYREEPAVLSSAASETDRDDLPPSSHCRNLSSAEAASPDAQRRTGRSGSKFVFTVTGERAPEAEGHRQLFHELFGRSNIEMANLVLEASQPDASSECREAAESILRDVKLRTKTARASKTTAPTHTAADLFYDEKGAARYTTGLKDYLYDLLPLTLAERRWLLNVLDDPLAEIFLSAGEITALDRIIRAAQPAREDSPSAEASGAESSGLRQASSRRDRECAVRGGEESSDLRQASSRRDRECAVGGGEESSGLRQASSPLTPLRMDLIRLFDQDNRVDVYQDGKPYRFSSSLIYADREDPTVLQLKTIYEAIRSEKALLVCRTEDPDASSPSGCCVLPEQIVYSRMHNSFCLDAFDQNSRARVRIPLNDHIRVVPAGRPEDLSAREDQQEPGQKKVTLTLRPGVVSNLPDRFLTEFSLWEKTCIYDRRNDRYDVELFYPPEDEEEIADRIMSYGSNIRVKKTDSGSDVYQEIRRRIDRQQRLLSESMQ